MVNSFLSAKYSYAYVHTASLSSNRSVAPQNHQNISEAKYFGNPREQFRVLFILKKSSILNFENPLLKSVPPKNEVPGTVESVPPYCITTAENVLSGTTEKVPPHCSTAKNVPPFFTTAKKESPVLFLFFLFFLNPEKSLGSVVFLFGRTSFSHLNLLS